MAIIINRRAIWKLFFFLSWHNAVFLNIIYYRQKFSIVPFYIWGIPGRFDQAMTLTILFYFSFKYVMDDHKKMTYTNFQIF